MTGGEIARSLLLTGPRRLEWIEDALPAPGPREVLVETRTGAISVGSEVAQYLGAARTSGRRYPQMTGYESVGTVRACGAGVRDMHPGDRVIGLYGHRTHAVLVEDRLIAVPAAVTDPVALLSILTCDVTKGIRKVSPTSEEPVLIVAAGAIGCLTLWVLRRLGVLRVDVVEPLKQRQDLALRLGARRVGAPKERTAGEAVYAVGFECSDTPAGFSLLQNGMCRGGRICVLSDGNGAELCLAPAFRERELSIVASSDGTDYPGHAAWYFSQPRADLSALEELFDWSIPAVTLAGAFQALADGRRKAVKVLVRYGNRDA